MTVYVPLLLYTLESAVRRVINLRFKASGTFWNEDTVSGLMHLRACFKAGRWDEMMERVLTQTFTIPSFEPLTQEAIEAAIPLEPLEETATYEEIPQAA